LINFYGTTANSENKKDIPTKELSFCHGLFWREGADQVHEIPAIGIRKCGFEGRLPLLNFTSTQSQLN
jgi:hypothetical protein